MKVFEAIESWSEQKINAVARWIVTSPIKSMLLTLLVVAVSAAGLQGYNFTLDYRAFFSKENPQLLAFEKLQDDYSKTDAILIAVAPRDGQVFTPETIKAIHELTEKSWQIPYSQRVDSITNYQRISVTENEIRAEDVFSSFDNLSAEQLVAAKDTLIHDEFMVNLLINPQASVTAVRVNINLPGLEHKKEVPEVVNFVRAMVADIESRYPNLETHLGGQIIVDKVFPETTDADQGFVWPAFSVVMACIMIALYRSVLAMLATYVGCVLAVLGGAGFVGYHHFEVNASVTAAPVMILSLAFADAIHVIVSWLNEVNRGKSKQEAMYESIRVNAGPIFVTTLMTAIGFLTLHFNDSPPYRVLGYMVASGVVYAAFATFFFIAPLLLKLPVRIARKQAYDPDAELPVMNKLAEFIIAHRIGVAIGFAAFAALLISFVPRNVINDDPVKYFVAESKMRKDLEFINANLTGIGEINYSFPALSEAGITDPQYLKQVDAFNDWIKQQDYVVATFSVVDIIKRINMLVHNNDKAYYKIPDTQEEAAQYLLQYEMSMPFGQDLNNMIRFDRSEARLRISVGTSSGQKIIELDDKADAYMAKNMPEKMWVEGASLSLMFAHIGERSINNMFGGMLGSLLAESLAVMILFGAIRLGFVSFIGNIVPIGMAFGCWALLDGNIDLGLTVVLGISFSIVVDDTIHFVSKYERGRKHYHLSSADAVRYAYRNVGFALFVTSLVLGCGFAMLGFSGLQITVNTALVTTTTILLALLTDMLFLPALFLLIDNRKFVPHAEAKALAH